MTFATQPDLPFRLREGLEFNALDFTTIHGQGAEGYTTYPFHEKFSTAGW